MSIYLDDLPKQDSEFRKEAAFGSRVSETTENWPQELTSELYKQLPYLSDYEVNVNLDRVDQQRGFAFGYADVANRTERPEVEHEDAGLPHIRVPLIIEERSVRPFETFLDGERVLPLTEERIRETLFNPASFDISAQTPRDPSLIEPLMPPTRSGAGYGGEYKMASARSEHPTLLHAISSTISEKEARSFASKLASDHTVRAGLTRAGVMKDLIEVFGQTKSASASERLQFIADRIEPTVITLQKMPGGDFLLKHASVDAFNPQTAQAQTVPGAEAQEMLGPDAQGMMPGQTATLVPQPIQIDEEEDSAPEVVAKFGEYKVFDTMGNQLMGWVFPTTLAWDGAFSKQPVALFTNGSAYAFQDSIVGDLVGTSTNLPVEGQPVGDGVLFNVSGGKAICTQPMTVRSAMAGPDGNPKLICHDVMGQQFHISFMEGLSQPHRMSDMEYAFPLSWKFMRLNNQTQLQGGGNAEMGGEEEMMDDGQGGMSDAPKPSKPKKSGDKKPAKKDDKAEKKDDKKEPSGTKVEVNVGEKVKKEKTSAVLWFNGGYNIDGGCGLHKIAADQRYDMSPVDAEFMLGLLGVDGHTAKQKVAQARREGSVKLAGLKTITLLSERYAGAEKRASAFLSQIPDLHVDLVKEASSLTDPTTVNTVLALNFISPENLETFIEYIPELEETTEKLAEMLLFSQIGMNQLPTGAVSRAMRNMENVVTQLKNIASIGPQPEED